MESNASRIRRLSIILIVLTVFINVGYGQSESAERIKYYGHVNVGFSVNESKLITDSINGLGYDFGVGGSLEYEMFFSDKLSVFGGAGITYIKSSTNSKSNSLGLIAADFRIAPKYSLNGKIHVIAGPTILYSLKTNIKTSYIDESWSSVDYIPEMQFGAFGGFEAYLNDWSALRALAFLRTRSSSFELALIITPQIASF